MGGIECETTDGVSADLQAAFVKLFGDLISDREARDAQVHKNLSRMSGDDAAAPTVFADHGIESIIACPVRSEMGISGALVAFYPSSVWFPEERREAMLTISELVATALSYASAMEQSGNLLDDLAGANQELSLQATIDGLTGLANHRTLQQTLADMCGSSRSGRKNVFSLLMLDADHFKIYNDTHGHRQGDAALRDIAKLISSELRQGDLAARYGGEEFAVVLRGIGKDSALGIAERIRRRAADHQLQKGSLTLSIGVAEYPLDGDTPAEVIERADRSLYHAKVTGRNRVVVWGSGGCATESAVAEDGTQPKHSILVVTKPSEPMGKVIGDTLTAESYSVVSSSSTEEAAEALRKMSFDLAMISIEALPNVDVKSLAILTSMHPDLPIVLIVSDPAIEVSRVALRHGASDVLATPFVPEELPLVLERNIERRRAERQRITEKSTSIMLQAIEALVAAIDAKDHYTAGHSQRVTSLALAIADDLSLSNEDRYALELAAKLHDVGKVALPDSALNKQAHLSEEEWQAMREHPAIGCKIVATIDELAYVSAIIRHHHERLDGTGYPDGLQGQAIPYLAQVIAVADSYEAMTAERAHRGRLTPREAVEELRSCAGKHYAAEIVDILERKLKESGDIAQVQQTEAA
jgi:putative two-component system response regulator